jgi:hypothetical protein
VHIIVYKIKESTVIALSLNKLVIKISAELHSLFKSLSIHFNPSIWYYHPNFVCVFKLKM